MQLKKRKIEDIFLQLKEKLNNGILIGYKKINNCNQSKFTVNIVSKVIQSPKKYSKRVIPLTTPCVTHICDYESNDKEHIAKFKNILSEMKDATLAIGYGFEYKLGFSNFTFDLWIILHKQICNGTLANRTQYLHFINDSYKEKFESLDHYKREVDFKRCLSKLSLDNVRDAITRSKKIMLTKQKNNEKQLEYKGFYYYKDNPAITIWESVADILDECGILNTQ